MVKHKNLSIKLQPNFSVGNDSSNLWIITVSEFSDPGPDLGPLLVLDP
jgi:hypothetical protein